MGRMTGSLLVKSVTFLTSCRRLPSSKEGKIYSSLPGHKAVPQNANIYSLCYRKLLCRPLKNVEMLYTLSPFETFQGSEWMCRPGDRKAHSMSKEVTSLTNEDLSCRPVLPLYSLWSWTIHVTSLPCSVSPFVTWCLWAQLQHWKHGSPMVPYPWVSACVWGVILIRGPSPSPWSASDC